jgi:hypothetical protein
MVFVVIFFRVWLKQVHAGHIMLHVYTVMTLDLLLSWQGQLRDSLTSIAILLTYLRPGLAGYGHGLLVSGLNECRAYVQFNI